MTANTSIWKENRRNIRWNPIRRSILILIWSLIPIQFRRLPPPPLPPPPPFLVANPSDGVFQHPRPVPSPGRHLHLSGLLILPFRPILQLVGIIFFVIALRRIGVGQRVGGGTYLPTSIPSRSPPPPPTSPILLLLEDLPPSLTFSLPRLSHMIPGTIISPPKAAVSFVKVQRYQYKTLHL